MGDESIDLLALFHDIDGESASAFPSFSDESDLVDLELDFFADDNDAAGIDPRPSSASDVAPHTAIMTTTVSSKSHVERCRHNRKRKKQEVDELRASAETLEAMLSQLRDQTTVRSSSSSWRSVSKRTLLDCHRVVRENSQLREMLQQQFAAAHGIQRAIAAVPDFQEVPCRLTTGLKPSKDDDIHKTLSRPGSATCTALQEHPGEQYYDLFKRIHSVYEQNASGHELSWLKIGTRKISMEMVTHTGSGCPDMCVQVMECQQLSMSLASIKDATWEHLTSPCEEEVKTQSDGSGRAPLARHGDDLFGDCGSDCKPVATEGDAPLGRLAVRRYVDTNRLTFVWECDGCFQCDAAKNPIGRVTERGWCTIEPTSDDPDSSTTVLRIQVQYLPQQSECKASSACQPSRQVNLSSDMALQLYRCTLARTFGAVEKEVFRKQSHSTPANRCS